MEFNTPLFLSILFSSAALWQVTRALAPAISQTIEDDFSDHLLQ